MSTLAILACLRGDRTLMADHCFSFIFAFVRPRLFVGMILILIFAEVLGLYGLIVALVRNYSLDRVKVAC